MIVELLSHFLSEETPGFGGEGGFQKNEVNQILKGKSSNTSKIQLSSHIGTHIDLPFHFDQEGSKLDDYNASFWIFNNVSLIEIPAEKNQLIDFSLRFNEIHIQTEFLIIKTGFEKKRGSVEYWRENPGLDPVCADSLRSHFKNLRCIGFDFISLSSFQNREMGRLAHRNLLSDKKTKGLPILIVEDMKLSNIQKCPRRITVAPLLIQGADGSPVTIIAEV